MTQDKEMELLCPRDLALRLGAIEPKSMTEHRKMKRGDYILMRDIETCEPMFWPLVSANAKTRQV